MKLAILESRVDVTVRGVDGEVIDRVGDTAFSYTRSEMKQKDEYQKLLGDGNARVSVGLGEKIGGPYGYSSVDVRINTTLTCNQDEETVRTAGHLAFRECVAVVDDIIDNSMLMLKSHLERNHHEGGRG